MFCHKSHVGSDPSSSWRNLLVFHVEYGQRKGLAGGEAGCFHWVMFGWVKRVLRVRHGWARQEEDNALLQETAFL